MSDLYELYLFCPCRKIFIGGLSYSTTSGTILSILSFAEGLAAYFGKFGSVKNAKVMTTMDNKSRGFGFCTFESNRVYQNVLRKKKHVIDNRRVIQRLKYNH